MIRQHTRKGKVFLVGAGPGDPDLLTVKALRTIQTADHIFYDRLVSREIRELFPAGTLTRYVGKAKGRHCVPQDQLHNLLIEAARSGASVCRLKGGDPFVFGRGGEELLALKNAGVETEVVPGITAAVGCAAYAGIPLTHRGIAQAVTFITAQGSVTNHLDWGALARMDHTVVFYMGLAECGNIGKQFLGEGKAKQTPVALIERGTTGRQRVIRGTLQQLAVLPGWYHVESPALIVVGPVAALADELHWFGQLLPATGVEMSA